MRSWMRTELFGLIAFAAGCGSSSPSGTVIVRPTLIAVVPSEIFPSLECSQSPGAFSGYVATLRDVSPGITPDGGAEVELPSSAGDGPTPCDRTTTYSYVGVGHTYVADVDGYDRTDLHAPTSTVDGGTVSVLGSRVLLDPTGQPAIPRWSARCGYVPGGFDQPGGGEAGASGMDSGADAGPACLVEDYQPPGVLALSTLTRHVLDCVDAVSFQLDTLGWSCGGPDGVASFTVDTGTGGDALASCHPLACAERAVLRVQSLGRDAADPTRVAFTVRALSSSGATLKQANCTVAPSRGLVVPAGSADCTETTPAP